MTSVREPALSPGESDQADAAGVTAPAAPWWRRRSGLLVLVGVVAVAAALRLYLVGFGLPDINHPDEPTNISVGEAMARHDDVLPSRFNYPSFLFDLIALVVKVGTLLGAVSGTPIVERAGLGIAHTPDPGLVLTMRLCTVVASVATAVIVARTVQRRVGPVGGVVAGLLLAVSPIAVESGVYITPDAWTGLFCAVALAGALAILSRGSWVAYLVCGLGIGLAAGAKYNAAAVGLALLVAHALRHQRRVVRRSSIGLLGLALIAAVVAVVATTPGWVLAPSRVWSGISFEMMHYRLTHPGHESSSTRYYARALATSEPALLVLSLVAVIGAVRGRLRREVAVLASFAAAYALLVCLQKVNFERNLLPLLPALAMLAGIGAVVLRDASRGLAAGSGRRGAISPTATGVVLALGLVVAVGYGAISSRALRPQLDEPARHQARAWIEQHLPTSATIVEEGYGPWLDPVRYPHASVRFRAFDGPLPADVDAVVVTDRTAGRYLDDPALYPREVAAYQALRATRCLAARFSNHGPWVEILVPCR